MPDHAMFQRRIPNATGADARKAILARWLFNEAIRAGFCERCDPDVIPPLYNRLATIMLSEDGRDQMAEILEFAEDTKGWDK